jgi:hypothetical protein
MAMFLLVAACAPGTPSQPEDAARRAAFIAAVDATEPGSQVDLASALGTDTDRAVVLGAYADNDAAREALGFDFDLERVSP